MDLIDDPSSSKLTAVFEIPGIKTNDISLHIRDGCLIVQGERKNPYPKNAQVTTSLNEEMEIEGQSSIKVPIQELRFGTFYRSIRVPSGIKESDVSATLHEGMLTVTWPRAPAAAASRTTSSDPPASISTAAGTAFQ
jgi:HSP20 family molecular chaperone IbpA